MKKLLFSALALTLIFALSASATLTRVVTLGEAYVIVKDEANIMMFPSTINLYRGLVLGEVSSATNPLYPYAGLYSVGAHYDFGADKGVVGLYLSQVGLGLEPFQPDPADAWGVVNGVDDNRLNLFYGRVLGETPFGLALSLYRDSHKVDGDPADKTEQSNMNLGIQLGLTVAENWDLTGGVSFTTWTNKDAAGDDVTEPESNLGINLGGRYWYAFNDNVDFVPHLMFMYDMSGYSVANVGKDTWTTMGLDLGWGVNIRPEDRILLLFDFGINFEATTAKDEPTSGTSTELKTTDMHLPYFKVGLEGHVTKWWDVRMGAVKRWVSVSDDVTEDIAHKFGSAETSTYLGSGFHFGNLHVDAWLDPDFVLRGPYFASGSAANLAFMGSVKYAWK